MSHLVKKLLKYIAMTMLLAPVAAIAAADSAAKP